MNTHTLYALALSVAMLPAVGQQPAPQPPAPQPAPQAPAAQPAPQPAVQQPGQQPMVNLPQPGQPAADHGNKPAPPSLFGVEMPMADPANDTVSYNGGMFDVGNNAVVRARFEKYLQQTPDDSTEARRYRDKMNQVLNLTQKSARSKAQVGSETLLKIGRGLYEMNDYSGDSGQAGTLASAMASAIAVQYGNLAREKKNEKLAAEIKKLVDDTNTMTNRNTGKGNKVSVTGRGAKGATPTATNTFKIATNTKEITGKEAARVKNDADAIAATALSKVNYQGMLVSFLAMRRYDHALIGANVYRHLFRDGDTTLKLEKDSQAAKVFQGVGGMPPTVNSIATAAATARREIDQNMEAVTNMLAQNRLTEATQHLIEAVALGEYMQSVATFPVESRRRIAEFWDLRKNAYVAMNARDYGTMEEIAKRMKELDPTFNDSLLRSYYTAKQAESNLHLRNAAKAMRAGDDETFNKEIAEAALIWPLNPKLKEGQDELEKLDSFDPVKDDFKTLAERKQYRTIFNEQNKYEVVATDPALKERYKEIITLVGTIDGMLEQLDIAAGQDRVMGPCMAYEMMLEKQEANPDFAADEKFRDALNRYALGAHDFVDALDKAKDCEARREYGSALANFMRAQCLYPRSSMAGEGVKRLTEEILKAKF